MITINLNDTPHNFEKKNLVTIMGKSGTYDIMKCKNCGIEGKTTSLSTMAVPNKVGLQKAMNCTNSEEDLRTKHTGKTIQITYCTAQGSIFANLTPDSLHKVIDTPANQKADTKGVWVQGVGEPVKVLNDEFIFHD